MGGPWFVDLLEKDIRPHKMKSLAGCGTDLCRLQVLPPIRGRTEHKLRPQVPNLVGSLEPKAFRLQDCR